MDARLHTGKKKKIHSHNGALINHFPGTILREGPPHSQTALFISLRKLKFEFSTTCPRSRFSYFLFVGFHWDSDYAASRTSYSANTHYSCCWVHKGCVFSPLAWRLIMQRKTLETNSIPLHKPDVVMSVNHVMSGLGVLT